MQNWQQTITWIKMTQFSYTSWFYWRPSIYPFRSQFHNSWAVYWFLWPSPCSLISQFMAMGDHHVLSKVQFSANWDITLTSSWCLGARKGQNYGGSTYIHVLINIIQYGLLITTTTEIAKFMGPTWGPPESCRPQMCPILDPWTMLSENLIKNTCNRYPVAHPWVWDIECFFMRSESDLYSLPSSLWTYNRWHVVLHSGVWIVHCIYMS